MKNLQFIEGGYRQTITYWAGRSNNDTLGLSFRRKRQPSIQFLVTIVMSVQMNALRTP